MAQLKDTVVAGSLRATEGIYTNEIQCTKLKALTSASATTNYGVGTNGQILTSNGTNAYWSSDIPVSIFNSSSSGLVPQTNITSNITSYFLCADGTWRIPTGSGSGSSSYNLPVASSDELGGIKIGYSANTTSTARNLGVQLSSYKAYVSVPIFSGTTAGLVPAPTSASSSKFLCSTGSWETIDTSGSGSGSGTTSISPATTSAVGGIRLYADGETVPNSGYKLSLDSTYNKAYVVIPTAASGVKGLVSTGAQTFDGQKTFTDGAIIGNANSINTNTETSYTLYGTGLLQGTNTTIQTNLLKICNTNADANYITGQPYKCALQLGISTSSSIQGTSYPSITFSEIFTRYLQIKAPYMLLTRNTYECYNSTISYYPDDIVWYAGKYYTNNGSNGPITDTTYWTPMQPLNAIACDSDFAPFIDKKYALGSTARSWSALYLNGYKIQCVNGNLTITSA